MDSSLWLSSVSPDSQNVEFLISQRQISPADGREILAKLPNAPDRSMAALEQRTQNLLITPPPSTAPPSYPQALPAQHARAKALWDFNEDGQNSQDLSFRTGQIIEILEETNSDWWTGLLNGREGVFPANYVEKLPPPAPSPYNALYQPPTSGPPQAYQAPSGPHQAHSTTHMEALPQLVRRSSQLVWRSPPNPYGGPPPLTPKPSQAPAAAAPPAEAPPKKNKFGKFGSIAAQSAAGGLGFGAGLQFSSVVSFRQRRGSGIVNSIF
ncbi:SH3 domain-containing protein [Mycena galopus ATCC 62051]|nr:SH3 domain-containing protein [Mycena galopus ATCC 62051]